MSTSESIIKAITPLSRQFASPEYDKAIASLKEYLPFQVHEYGPDNEHNGWKIPPKYRVTKALLIKNEEVIYDGLHHPLAVPCHAAPFTGDVDLQTLKQHLWYDHRFYDAIPYHFRFSYRPWERDWGFCVTREFYDRLEEGTYSVRIEIEEGDPELKVLEYVVEGDSGIEFAFVSHLDHPGMAVDDLSGCAVGVELFQQLTKINTRHTYRLILLQEIIGSEIHLHTLRDRLNIQEALFLEMLGADVPLVLQQAYTSPTAMESAVRASAGSRHIELKEVPFRASAKNDEIVFEAYGIPTAAVCRFPYPEYHSSKDNESIVSQDRLTESVLLLRDVVQWHEEDVYVEKCFDGIPCLSSPQFDLYVDPGQPALGDKLTQLAMHRFMEGISLVRGRQSLRMLCAQYDVPFDAARAYLSRWEAKGLAKTY